MHGCSGPPPPCSCAALFFFSNGFWPVHGWGPHKEHSVKKIHNWYYSLPDQVPVVIWGHDLILQYITGSLLKGCNIMQSLLICLLNTWQSKAMLCACLVCVARSLAGWLAGCLAANHPPASGSAAPCTPPAFLLLKHWSGPIWSCQGYFIHT
jgi:hypothetical protein